jgi:hypothetical protein
MVPSRPAIGSEPMKSGMSGKRCHIWRSRRAVCMALKRFASLRPEPLRHT